MNRHQRLGHAMAQSTKHEEETAILDGFDDEGDQYESIDEFWALTDERHWYRTLSDYWKDREANIDDMLGGMSKQIHKIDILTSIEIVNHYWPKHRQKNGAKTKQQGHVQRVRALDCGAGIGRVTESVLGPRFDRVDLIEINPDFCRECVRRIGKQKYFGKIMAKSLHKVTLKTDYYHCIWCQWTLEHLTEEDLLSFLKQCKRALKRSSGYSYCVFKENVCRNNLFYVNTEGSSIIRHQTVFEDLFERAGLNVVDVLDQNGFPKDLWPQKIFVLN